MGRIFARVDRSAVPALFLVFASMGASSATVPAVIPALAERAPGALEEYLAAVPALFLGLLAGVLLSSAVGRALSPRRVTLIGSAVQASGFLALTVSSAPAFFVGAVLIVGIGFGLAEAGGSVLARAVAREETARLLSALTGTVAIVAAGVPLLIALTPAGRAPHVVFVLVAVVHLAGFALVLRSREGESDQDGSGSATAPPDHADARGARPVGLVGVLLAVGAALALYVGVETVYAGWSSTIPLLVLEVPAQQAAIGTSVFWALLAAGRYFATFLLSRSVPPLVYLVATTTLASAALGVTAAILPWSPVLATVALCVAVAALGPCYSLMLGAGLSRIPVARARWATGLLVACGASGGALVPTVVLAVADNPTSPVVFAMTGVLTIVSGLVVALTTRRAAAAVSPVHT